MTRTTPLRLLVLALCTAGCGGGASVTETNTNPDVLRDVPELRAASEGSGGVAEGGSGGGGSSGGGGGRRYSGSTVSAGGGNEVFTGRFGGPEPATSLSDGCPGWVSAQPNHVIQVPALPFAQLVVTVDGYDTTLAVQLALREARVVGLERLARCGGSAHAVPHRHPRTRAGLSASSGAPFLPPAGRSAIGAARFCS